MFRITRIFENQFLVIYKIEGKVGDESLQAWTEELKALHDGTTRKVILDLCRAWSISPKAAEILVADLPSDVQVMNPSMEIRNTFHAVGLSAKVLE